METLADHLQGFFIFIRFAKEIIKIFTSLYTYEKKETINLIPNFSILYSIDKNIR